MPENKPHYLYRHFDAERTLLYVGRTLSTLTRTSSHKDASPWFIRISQITVESFPSKEAAIKAERVAVVCENPLHNSPRLLKRLVPIRPLSERGNVTPTLGVRLDPEIKVALERAAADDGRSLSSLIAKIVTDWCKRRPGPK